MEFFAAETCSARTTTFEVVANRALNDPCACKEARIQNERLECSGRDQQPQNDCDGKVPLRELQTGVRSFNVHVWLVGRFAKQDASERWLVGVRNMSE